MKGFSDIKHLENEDFVASYTFKYIIQNNTCELAVLLRALEYILTTSTYLAEKIGAKSHVLNFKTLAPVSKGITRCSYKFCQYSHFCEYNYPEKKGKVSKGCYSDHFVHHKLVQDLQFLISFVKKTYGSDQPTICVRSNQEIIKCVNTIAFVVKHMYDELWNIYLSCNGGKEYESLHRNIIHNTE